MLIPSVTFLATANLTSYPTISGWDEGMYLQFAGNLAYRGEYVTIGGSGPTLIVPIALALRLLGNSLGAARLIMVAYLLAALACVYLLVRSIGGRPAAIASIPLFLIAGYTTYDTIWVGRQVLAEVPSLAFALLGLWLWIKSWRSHQKWLIASAFLFALAVVTKNQFLWIFGLGIVLIFLADRIYYRQLRWASGIVPLAGIVLGYGSWFLLSLWIVHPGDRASYLEAQSALTAASFLHVSLQRSLANLELFYHSEQWLPALVSIAYGLFSSRARTQAALQKLLLPLFTSVALLSFLGPSLPWARYLYLTLALASLCTALLIGDLIGWVGRRGKLGGLLTVVAFVLSLSLLSGQRIVGNIQRIVTTNDRSAEQFAALVDQTVPSSANVLNWEWEIEFYSNRSFVHPPYRLFPAMIDQVYNQRYDPLLDQPRIPPQTHYLIIGPFASQTNVFTSALERQHHALLVCEGPYQLYQTYP
jgi:4-amino-4-deoxy-L-arabinose transferase-like glycosyltransferase